MKSVLIAVVVLSFAFVIVVAAFGDVASVAAMGGYVVASLSGFILSRVAPVYGAWIKWAWVALSLGLAFAIFAGPLDYMRLG